MKYAISHIEGAYIGGVTAKALARYAIILSGTAIDEEHLQILEFTAETLGSAFGGLISEYLFSLNRQEIEVGMP